jgi:hypothetical protein
VSLLWRREHTHSGGKRCVCNQCGKVKTSLFLHPRWMHPGRICQSSEDDS